MTTKTPYQLLKDGIAGQIITWAAGGGVMAVGPGSSGEVLTSNGAGASPTFQTLPGGGDMLLAGVQTVTGAKTFNSSTMIYAGATSGTITVNATAVAGTNTLTLPAATDTLVGLATTDTLTNKSIDLTNNTLTGTTAQFNTALSDGSFATLAGSETLTNKSIAAGSNTITGLVWDTNMFADGTDGEIPTFDSNGEPAMVAVGTSGHVLTSNGAGSPPTFQAAAGGSFPTAAGALNTYSMAYKIGSAVAFGGTTSGGNLQTSNANGDSIDPTLSGTWRCMGDCNTTNAQARTTLWLRIA